jgi:hypothetical protein
MGKVQRQQVQKGQRKFFKKKAKEKEQLIKLENKITSFAAKIGKTELCQV